MADTREKLIELLKQMGKREREQGGVTWYDVADRLIANGVTVGDNWVSTAERLPRENKKVLAYRSFGDSHTVFLARRWNGKWVDAEWNCYRYGVTHWMPMPEPPKGE